MLYKKLIHTINACKNNKNKYSISFKVWKKLRKKKPSKENAYMLLGL